jgi:hypothetical protein
MKDSLLELEVHTSETAPEESVEELDKVLELMHKKPLLSCYATLASAIMTVYFSDHNTEDERQACKMVVEKMLDEINADMTSRDVKH